MEKIPTGFMGYKKEVVNNIIEKQNNLLKTQQKDIDYLRKELSRLQSTPPRHTKK